MSNRNKNSTFILKFDQVSSKQSFGLFSAFKNKTNNLLTLDITLLSSIFSGTKHSAVNSPKLHQKLIK